MISKKMAKALNDQVNKELYSAYLYVAMSAHSSEENLKGFAHWLAEQAKEETSHALKFYKYLLDQGAGVKLLAIAEPPASWTSSVKMFAEVLAHEKKVTASIHRLVELATAEKDYATQVLLQWFVTEQVEEESSAEEILSKLKLIGQDPRGLFMVDRELAARAAH